MKLKDNQKVYIRGGKNEEEGKRVIAELERRGGANSDGLTGAYTHFLYYIKQNGEIDYMQDPDGKVAEFMKEYFTEVKVNVKVDDWPKKGAMFFIVGPDLTWDTMENRDNALSKAVIKSGNCFHSLSEADYVAKEFRKIVKRHKQLKKQRNGKQNK